MLYLPWRSSDDHHDDHNGETSRSATTARSFIDVIVTNCVVTGGNGDETLVEGSTVTGADQQKQVASTRGEPCGFISGLESGHTIQHPLLKSSPGLAI